VAYNAALPGQVLEAFDRVHASGDAYRAYYEEFLALGRRLRRLGNQPARARRGVTARDCYLRAATYLDQALYFTLASATPTRAQEAAVYREMESCFAAAAARFVPAFKRVSIPYERRTLPGWLLTPAGSRIRRPTLILNNGSDAQNVDLLVSGGLAALERGWNALIFEGPGQGSNLFLHGIPFRPDWEKVITPVVTWLRDRPEVDKRRIALFGSSFGGYLVPRAAAFGLPSTTRFQITKRSEIYGNGSFYDKMRLARDFLLSRAVVGKISAPAIIAQAAEEQFFPDQSKQLHHWLHVKKSLATFTVAEGAQFHCEPMAPTLRNDTVLDWLEANLRPTR